MAQPGVTVAVVDNGVLAALLRARHAISNMLPVYRAVGRKLESNVNVRFDTKTAPDGSPWKEWSPATARARKREGRGTLLEYSGRMRDSLTFDATSTGVEVGFGVPYAAAHEKGATYAARTAVMAVGSRGKNKGKFISKKKAAKAKKLVKVRFLTYASRTLPARPLLLDNGRLSDSDADDVIQTALRVMKRAMAAEAAGSP